MIRRTECIYLSILIEDVPEGACILINDGEVKFTVIEVKEEGLYCHVDNQGVVKNKKSINVPDVSINLPSLSNHETSV